MLPWVTAVCNVRSGWEYFQNFNTFQKNGKDSYVKISRFANGYCVQLFLRGAVNKEYYCLVEMNTEDHTKESLEKVYAKGEVWLKLYCDGKEEREPRGQVINGPFQSFMDK